MSDEHQNDQRLAVSPRSAGELHWASGTPESERMSTTNLLTVVWRRRWIVICCILVSVASAIVYLTKATPIYSSSSVVYVQQAVPKVVSDELMQSGNSNSYLFTQCQIIQSTAILAAAAQLPELAQAKVLHGMENPVGFLKSAVVAQPAKQGDLITVSMEAVDANDAATIVNGVVHAYTDYLGKQHKSTAVEVLRILQKELDRHEADLRVKEKAKLEFKKANPDLAFQSDKGSLVVNRLVELSTALTQARLRSLELKTALEEVTAAQDEPAQLRLIMTRFDIGADSWSAGGELNRDLRQARLQLETLTRRLGPQHELVIDAEKNLAGLKNEITESTRESSVSAVQIVKKIAELSERRTDTLQRAVEAERLTAVDQNIKAAEYEYLSQEASRTRDALNALDSRMKEINVTEDVGALTVSVLETAKPNLNPVHPKRGTTLGMGLVAGLMVGLGGALLRDMMDKRLRSTDEIAAFLGLPILGAVPHMVKATGASERGREIHLEPRSDVSEAYRTIRTAIYFGLSQSKSAKTIAVTSPSPGDGKTTLISNLAISVAQSGRRVLLIDADCRRPMQHKVFGLPEGAGLSTVLVGQASIDGVIMPTEVPNLDILPCGPLPHNPAELLDSQAFLDLLNEVSTRYDQILIDSPPVVPVTDARIIAASCDATVLVLRAEKSTRRLAEHARDALFSVGGTLVGVVVNDVPRGKDGYGYYYGYGSYGRYGATTVVESRNGNGHGSVAKGPASLRSPTAVPRALENVDD